MPYDRSRRCAAVTSVDAYAPDREPARATPVSVADTVVVGSHYRCVRTPIRIVTRDGVRADRPTDRPTAPKHRSIVGDLALSSEGEASGRFHQGVFQAMVGVGLDCVLRKRADPVPASATESCPGASGVNDRALPTRRNGVEGDRSIDRSTHRQNQRTQPTDRADHTDSIPQDAASVTRARGIGTAISGLAEAGSRT
jgi:hypothetical protein